ncbi:hydroxyacid dehydrogenase [Candidatus Woesearchaeota archaeon]|nr:hydroxyacid dehydrogenase [Candidatus Woesearchaeota archaeon]
MVKKIVVTQTLDLLPDQKKRLEALGKVSYYNDIAKTPEEWLERCKGADIVLSGKFGLKQKIYELPNTFFSLPFVGIGWIDKKKLKQNKVTVSYCPGCNKDAVSEWVIGMLLTLFREFNIYINSTNFNKTTPPPPKLGLTNKKVCILGKGNIGSRVRKICSAFDMQTDYFRRGDDLIEKVKDSDVIIDCLGSNKTTWGLLNRKFFQSLKKGSYFLTITSSKIYDVDAMIEALDQGILAGAANDSGSIPIGDTKDPFYQKLLKHPKILVTPHIAFLTDVTCRVANDMMIDNVEAWLKGKPINLVE